jgi:trk system potassium uptake protein TrkA
LRKVLAGITGEQTVAGGTVVVIGLGRFGSALARTLVDMDQEVLAVDVDTAPVQRYAQELTQVVQADATSVHALRQLGAADISTAVVCIGSDIEASVLTVAALVDLGVGNIWATAGSDAHGTILQRVGCHHVVFPQAEMGERVAHLLTGTMLEYIALDEDFAIVETAVPPELDGARLADAQLRTKYGVTVVCVKPTGQAFTYATADTVLRAGDLILVAGEQHRVEHFALVH